MVQKPLPPQRLGAHQALQVRAAVSGLRQWREDFGVDRPAYPRPAVGAERRGLQQLAHGAARCTMATQVAAFVGGRAAVVGAASPFHHRPACDDASYLCHQVGVGMQRVGVLPLVTMVAMVTMVAVVPVVPVVAEQAVGTVGVERLGHRIQKCEQVCRGGACIVVQAAVHVAQRTGRVACSSGPSGWRSDQAPEPLGGRTGREERGELDVRVQPAQLRIDDAVEGPVGRQGGALVHPGVAEQHVVELVHHQH